MRGLSAPRRRRARSRSRTPSGSARPCASSATRPQRTQTCGGRSVAHSAARPAGALLFTCNGARHEHVPPADHDARRHRDAPDRRPRRLLLRGEIGLVGGKAFPRVHGHSGHLPRGLNAKTTEGELGASSGREKECPVMSYLPDIYQHFERAFPPSTSPTRSWRRAATRQVRATSAAPGSSSSGSRLARSRGSRPLARPPRARRADASGGATPRPAYSP